MSRIVVTVVLVVVVAVLLAAAGAALSSPLYAPEVLMATGPSTQDSPDGNPLAAAWEDDAAGDWNVVVGLSDDIPTGVAPAVVPAAAGDQRHPVVGDDIVVYEDDRNGDWDLYASDWRGVLGLVVGFPPERAVVTGSGNQTDPDISGETVVYEDDSRGNADIAVHYLDGDRTQFLSSSSSPQVDPAIDGKWVVWADRRNGNWDIYAWNLTTSALKRVTTNRADQIAPQIGRGQVVYQDHRSGDWDIYEYDLASGKERRLTSGASDQTAPSIDPDPWVSHPPNVVYVDDRRDAGDIYLRDGATGIIKPVSTAAGAQTAPDIDEGRVVWSDARAGQPDVYRSTLRYPTIHAAARAENPPFNAYGAVSGSLDNSEGAVVGDLVYAVRNGVTYKSRVQGDAGAAFGRFSIVVGRVQRKVAMRVWYPGGASSLPAVAGVIVIKPKASVSRPTLRYPKPPPSSNGGIVIQERDEIIISGSLAPHHPAGSKAVTLRIYRKNGLGNWELEKAVKAAVRGSGSVSTYEIKVRVNDSFPCRHKVQAVHADADHAETLSALSRILGL